MFLTQISSIIFYNRIYFYILSKNKIVSLLLNFGSEPAGTFHQLCMMSVLQLINDDSPYDDDLYRL